MIIQWNDLDTTSESTGFVFNDTNRFFHDRNAFIPQGELQPLFKGTNNGVRNTFICHFQLSPTTFSRSIRIRILNGKFLDFTRDIERKWSDEVEINVRANIGKPLSVCFETNPLYGDWIMTWGNQDGLDYCPAQFDHFAFIRTSKPRDDNNICLPRFVVAPVSGFEPISNAQRGGVGQPYGRTIRQLRTFTATFTRVQVGVIEDYYYKASLHKPHFIVPYPESVEHVPPIWATLVDPPHFTKRAENGWHWNCVLSWREAY